MINFSEYWGILAALGIGLLIGAERERVKGTGTSRRFAGIRTFSIAALLGAVSAIIKSEIILAIILMMLSALSYLSYQRREKIDPGITSYLALLLTTILGYLAVYNSLLAAAMSIGLVLLLATKHKMHYYVKKVLTQQELNDTIIFLACAFILLPILPNKSMGPFQAINPYKLAELLLLVMAIGVVAYVLTRWLGLKFGLPIAGFVSGFISSTATIHAMGVRVKEHPLQMNIAVSAAVLSSISTIIQMTIIVSIIAPSILYALRLPLLAGGVSAVSYSVYFIYSYSEDKTLVLEEVQGRAFSFKMTLTFASILAGIFLLSAAVNHYFLASGLLWSAAITGFVDPHATAASLANLVAGKKLLSTDTVWPILICLTSNSVLKAWMAYTSGGMSYALKIIPGLIIVIVSMWISLYVYH